MPKFIVQFVIPPEKLSMIVGLLDREVEDIKISGFSQDDIVPVKRKKRVKMVTNGKFVPPASHKTFTLIQRVLSDGNPHHTSEIRDVFKKAGLSAGSVSPSMSKLQTKGHVKWVENATYQLTHP